MTEAVYDPKTGTTCPKCGAKEPASAWVAAHDAELDRGDLSFVCPSCKKRFTLWKKVRQ
jgi:hypothetical protein